MKLTKSIIDKIAPSLDHHQVFYRDAELKGFALRITANGVKSFIVEKRINRKVKRITLGRYGELTVEQARNEAKKLLGKIATGNDPLAERKIEKIKATTLKQVFDDYLEVRKTLKPSTIIDYQRVMKESFADWQNKPLLEISKDMVAKRHHTLGQNSQARANISMRVLRALFNFAMGQYEDTKGQALISENPVKRLSHTRAWYRIERRQTYIKSHELAAWYSAVQSLENETLRDYLLLVIFTGLRRQEAAQLRWDQVDLKAKTLTIDITKNNNSHTLPLSDFLHEMLKNRKATAQSDYVFPSTSNSASGFIVEPRKQMAKVINSSGVSFIIHDLRRTFITVAESLDISAYAVKRLANHKMNNDVTSGYIVSDVERLRKPMQQITDHLRKYMSEQNQDN